ncbi:MAG: carbamoyltransferase HypF [Candidatus Dormibacteraeota bacterium]|nr:carbamoyltransferase HypF [Candidatus Dormibacteraeota bacterium]
MRERLAVTVRGTVQGVGFRPFVYRLAGRHDLDGWVRNSTGPVEIEVEGESARLRRFLSQLTDEAPPLARIESLETATLPARGESGFQIVPSRPAPGDFQSIVPDAATCEDCRRELFDPHDRRFRYPFINCTNCGPRFTIIEDLPYDRAATTMKGFEMCAACRREYEDPLDRRFHAQPNACWDCGPRLSVALGEAVAALRSGLVVAVKGLGGYQLACNARDEAAVARLRERKRRPRKPLAVMVADPSDWCQVSADEWPLLRGPARPIVLLPYRGGLAAGVAPGLRELGAMLPYTPLHHLLLHDFGGPLVMTSGNLSEEPICQGDAEAQQRLAGIADLFLAHDRPIAARYDDSVVRWAAGAARVVRRARGLAPAPLPLPGGPPVVATGAHLKAAFTVARDGRAFVGPHVGDLGELATVSSFEEGLSAYRRLFRVAPVRVACDLHPDYASTRLAETLGEPVRVQHHHAHVASVIAEHGLTGRVCGVALDGVGLGPDGTVWGGEVLACDGGGYERVAHLAPVPLPGGDRCAREGWRMAAAYGLLEPPAGVDPDKYELVTRLARSGRAPLTTSAGRLFDAVASLLGVCQVSTYEGEAAARLEAVAEPAAQPPMEFELEESRGLFTQLDERRRAGETAPRLAAVFHDSLAAAVVRACVRTGLRQVALSGGCFQNRRLLEACFAGLRAAGLEPYANERVPANDGGISLGQALVALCSG